MKKILQILLFTVFAWQSFSQVPSYTAVVNGTPGTGYYFVAPLSKGNIGNLHMLLDSIGRLVYYKKFFGPNTFDFKLQPNGFISYARTDQFYLMDSTFTIVDSVACQAGISTDFHDMQILPNGHYLMLGEETVTMDLSSYNFFLQNNSPGSATADVLCLVIQELDINKNVVFEWHAKDYLPFDGVDEHWLNSPANVDWTHSNAVAMDTDGNILVSSRHFNEITKINRNDSSVMWRLGGKYNQFTFIGDTTPFYGQHDIRRLSNGNITLYDNGNHIVPHGARALEYQLDEINKTAELKWSYTYDSAMFAYATGNVQRLQNGNTLINYGINSSVRNIYFNVVDSSGNEQFQLTFDDTLFSYRSYNFNLPYTLPRLQISCFDSAGTKYLDAGAGYSSYRWNDGTTTQLLAVSTPGDYNVFVPFGQNGFLSSEVITVTDINNPCSTGFSDLDIAFPVKLYPNPVRDVLIIKINNTVFRNGSLPITISDATGRTVVAQRKSSSGNEVTLNISNLDPGMYVISVNNSVSRFIKVQ